MYSFLSDIRILDLTRLLPGPYATLLLADLGAEVIKIEEPQQGDPVRWLPPFVQDMSYRFALLNRNKKSLTIDLKKSDGRDLFIKLAQSADAVFEGFRPGVMQRLGIGYQAVRQVNAKIVYCSLSGYGQAGPYRDRVGHDINYIGVAGLLNLTGESRPIIPGVPVADLAGGMFAALSIVSALRARDQRSYGTHIDISMTDTIVSWMILHAAEFFGTGQDPKRGMLPLNGGWPYYNIYETSDGKYLSIGALEEKFWAHLCNALSLPQYAVYQFAEAKRAEIFAELRTIFKSKTRDEWLKILKTQEIPVAPVNELHETFMDPQIQFRQMRIQSDGLCYLRFPVHFSNEAIGLPGPAPKLGQHTDELLKQLGYGQPEIDSLREKGVI